MDLTDGLRALFADDPGLELALRVHLAALAARPRSAESRSRRSSPIARAWAGAITPAGAPVASAVATVAQSSTAA